MQRCPKGATCVNLLQRPAPCQILVATIAIPPFNLPDLSHYVFILGGNVSDNAAMATLEVNPDELPVTDPPASHVVIKVEAAAIAFTKESRILLSSESHLVYIQTDKPLYTPRQQGQLLICATRINST